VKGNVDSEFSHFHLQTNVLDYEASVVTRESESDPEGWIAEQIQPWTHASIGADKQPISPRGLVIKLRAIFRVSNRTYAGVPVGYL
jgi:hypothetical protein